MADKSGWIAGVLVKVILVWPITGAYHTMMFLLAVAGMLATALVAGGGRSTGGGGGGKKFGGGGQTTKAGSCKQPTRLKKTR